MKNFFLLVLFLAFSTELYSQKYSTILGQLWLSNTWTDRTMQYYTYSGGDDVLFITEKVWNSSSWVNSKLTTCSYFSPGILQVAIVQNWVSSTWENFRRTTKSYNSNWYLSETLIENWDTPSWVNNQKIIYRRDLNNLLVQQEELVWDSNTSSWDSIYNYLYFNNIDSTVQNEIFQEWDTISNSWINRSRNTYLYSATKKISSVFVESWYNGTWVTAYSYVYSYDSNDFLILKTTNTYDTTYASWYSSARSLYSNNPDGTVANLTYQSWSTSSGMWQNMLKAIYTYVPTAISNFETNSYFLYPNPASQNITVHFNNNFEGLGYIVDNLGQIILVTNISANEVQFDIQSLSSGTYNMVIQSGNDISSKQFIKE